MLFFWNISRMFALERFSNIFIHFSCVIPFVCRDCTTNSIILCIYLLLLCTAYSECLSIQPRIQPHLLYYHLFLVFILFRFYFFFKFQLWFFYREFYFYLSITNFVKKQTSKDSNENMLNFCICCFHLGAYIEN